MGMFVHLLDHLERETASWIDYFAFEELVIWWVGSLELYRCLCARAVQNRLEKHIIDLNAIKLFSVHVSNVRSTYRMQICQSIWPYTIFLSDIGPLPIVSSDRIKKIKRLATLNELFCFLLFFYCCRTLKSSAKETKKENRERRNRAMALQW